MTPETVPTQHRPVLRPHVHVGGESVRFLISRREWMPWSDDLGSALAVIDGQRTVDECSAVSGRDLRAVLAAMYDVGMIDFLEPVPAGPRRRVLVVEPHMDDAVLSIGGTMHRLRHEIEFTVLTAAGRSNFTSYYYLDRDYLATDVVSDLRRAESKLFTDSLHGHHVDLGLLEAPLRYSGDRNWSLDWYRAHRTRIGPFISHVSGEEEVAAWSRALEQHLDAASYDELWINLGVGTHTDHDLMRNASLELFVRRSDLFRRQPVRFYQDVPYAEQFPTHTDRIVRTLRAAGMELTERRVDISDVFDAKLRLISMFASQFKLEVLQPRIEASARAAAPAGATFGELFFEAAGATVRPPVLPLYGDADEIEPSLHRIEEWLDRAARSRVVNVFGFTALGRPAEDFEELRRALPNTTLRLRMVERHALDVEAVAALGIDARIVRKSRTAWFGAALALALRDESLLILRHSSQARNTNVLATLAARADTLQMYQLNHLMLALRHVRGGVESLSSRA